MVVMSSCQAPRHSSFPTLETRPSNPVDQTETSVTNPADPEEWVTPVYLSIAVPFGKEAAESLRLLFLARESGLEIDSSGNYIGSNVSRDDLIRFDAPLHLDVQTVSADEGVSGDQIASWRASGNMPDLMYCSRAAATPGLDHLLTLDELLYDHPLIVPDWVFPTTVDTLRQGEKLSGIPYLASIPLICFNKNLLEQLHVASLPLDPTWFQWQQWMESVQRALTDAELSATPDDLMLIEEDSDVQKERLQRAVFVHDDLSDILPFIPISLGGSGWAAWNGYSFLLDSQTFKLSASWLRERVRYGLSPVHLSDTQRTTAFNSTRSLRLEDRVVSWTIDSTDLAYWHQQSEIVVGESLMPHGNLQETPAASDKTAEIRMPVDVRCLVISRQSQEPEWAARFAAFVALDPDSLLMQSRYQINEGLYPVVDDPVVWSALVDRQQFGSGISTFRERFSNAAVSGRQLVAQWDNMMTDVFGKDALEYLAADESADLDQLFRNIQAGAGQILQEGE
jgi:hypothetical protein